MKKILLYLGAIIFIANKQSFGSLESVVNAIYAELQSVEEKKIKRILNDPDCVSKGEDFLYQIRGYYQYDESLTTLEQLVLPELPNLKV